MNDGLDPAGIAAFVAAISGVIAFACARPEQWGLRRVALGLCIATAAIAAILLSPSGWWYGAVVWGLHQIYLGWSYISRRRRTTHERAEYLEASAAVLAYVALADGRIDPREASIIRATYARAGFSTPDLDDVDRTLRDCERRFFDDGSDPARLFGLLRNACAVVVQHSNEKTRLRFLRAAITIAASDGFVNSVEESALRASAQWLGIPKQDYEHLYQSVVDPESRSGRTTAGKPHAFDEEQSPDDGPVVPTDLATYYAAVLGVPLSASPREIKRAYRENAKRYHPDVVAHKGPMFAREAEERFKELSKAYSFLRGGVVTP